MGCGVSKLPPRFSISAKPVPYSANAEPPPENEGAAPQVSEVAAKGGEAAKSAPTPEPQRFLAPALVNAASKSSLQLTRNPFQRSDAPPAKKLEAEIKDAATGHVVGHLSVIDSMMLKQPTVLRDAHRRILAVVSREETFDEYLKYAGVARVFAPSPREAGQSVARTLEGIPLYAWATIGPGTFKYRFPVYPWEGGNFSKQPAMIVVPENLVMSKAKVESPSGQSIATSPTRKTFDVEPGQDPLLVILSVLEIGFTQTVTAGQEKPPAKTGAALSPAPISQQKRSATAVW